MPNKFPDHLTPEIPQGVAVKVYRWEQWHDCEFKGDTLCVDGKGPIFPTDLIWVEGESPGAELFVEELGRRGFLRVDVGYPPRKHGRTN